MCIYCRRTKSELSWVRDRAAIISRWTWLQAQVSDLEYRIRQQSDIHRQLKASKRPISLSPSLPGELASSEKYEKHSNSVVSSAYIMNRNIQQPVGLSNVLSSSTIDGQSNGLVTSWNNLDSRTSEKVPTFDASSAVALPDDADKCSSIKKPRGKDDIKDQSYRAARCMAVRSWHRRKLIRPVGLHQVNRKAAQLSTVRCGCYTPVMPCTLCGGRYNNVGRPDVNMSFAERVALLDPTFHPVLSFVQGQLSPCT